MRKIHNLYVKCLIEVTRPVEKKMTKNNCTSQLHMRVNGLSKREGKQVRSRNKARPLILRISLWSGYAKERVL